MHGYGKEALKLFEQMEQSGINPNHVTFVGVLSACCHAGLVDEGWQYFDCMSHILSHYTYNGAL
jgi:pentatricopeptide repeat protein